MRPRAGLSTQASPWRLAIPFSLIWMPVRDARTIPFVPVPTIARPRRVNWEAKILQNSQGEQHATRCFWGRGRESVAKAIPAVRNYDGGSVVGETRRGKRQWQNPPALMAMDCGPDRVDALGADIDRVRRYRGNDTPPISRMGR